MIVAVILRAPTRCLPLRISLSTSLAVLPVTSHFGKEAESGLVVPKAGLLVKREPMPCETRGGGRASGGLQGEVKVCNGGGKKHVGLCFTVERSVGRRSRKTRRRFLRPTYTSTRPVVVSRKKIVLCSWCQCN